MAKDSTDQVTVDLLERRGRGRPRKADALTPAQRQKLWRQRHKGEDQQEQLLKTLAMETMIAQAIAESAERGRGMLDAAMFLGALAPAAERRLLTQLNRNA